MSVSLCQKKSPVQEKSPVAAIWMERNVYTKNIKVIRHFARGVVSSRAVRTGDQRA